MSKLRFCNCFKLSACKNKRPIGFTEHAYTLRNLIKKGIITVSIEDNGQGFEAAALPGKKSFGILGMKERVLAQGGNFELLSSMGKGTKMTIRLPFVSNKNIVN